MSAKPLTFAQRMEAAEKITAMFKLERLAHLLATLFALGILLYIGVQATDGPEGTNWEVVVGMFGSAGMIGITTSRILLMWNKVLSIVTGTPEGSS